jgi:hypothetical protein
LKPLPRADAPDKAGDQRAPEKYRSQY